MITFQSGGIPEENQQKTKTTLRNTFQPPTSLFFPKTTYLGSRFGIY
ncbi:MAG: hypothetical protein ACXITV_03005 [Luteibaculaceae bacterium]